jgi:hypothetical protein
MVICLFGDVRIRSGMEEREERLSDKLLPIVKAMPGFISMKSYDGWGGDRSDPI